MKITDPGPVKAMRANFIKRSFRDVADRDYIAARLLHRHQLWEQFYWMALQAIEKYLKAIILYHDGDTRKLGHDIETALKQAEAIRPLGMRISVRAKEFVSYLYSRGENRYFTFPLSTEGDELLHLDHTVWQIRRYCDDYFFPYEHQIHVDHAKARLAHVHEGAEKDKARFRIDKSSFLEMVLDDGKHPELRRALVWKNFYFAGRNRKKVQIDVMRHWAQPGNFIYPEILGWAKDRVRLDKDVIAAMEEKLRNIKSSLRPLRDGKQS